MGDGVCTDKSRETSCQSPNDSETYLWKNQQHPSKPAASSPPASSETEIDDNDRDHYDSAGAPVSWITSESVAAAAAWATIAANSLGVDPATAAKMIESAAPTARRIFHSKVVPLLVALDAGFAGAEGESTPGVFVRGYGQAGVYIAILMCAGTIAAVGFLAEGLLCDEPYVTGVIDAGVQQIGVIGDKTHSFEAGRLAKNKLNEQLANNEYGPWARVFYANNDLVGSAIGWVIGQESFGNVLGYYLVVKDAIGDDSSSQSNSEPR